MAEKNERRNETEKREEEMRVSQAEEKEAEEGRGSQASKGETEIRDSHISPEERKRNLEWKCLTCSATAPPMPGAYMGFIQHSCTGKRKIWLVDRDTGEQLANNAKQALQMGLIKKGEKPGEKLEEKLEEEPKEKGKGKEEEGEITEPQVSSAGFFRYTITLPADAFTLFNMAKAADLEDADISFDVWIWDCIRKRFEKDYKRQVVLAGIVEE